MDQALPLTGQKPHKTPLYPWCMAALVLLGTAPAFSAPPFAKIADKKVGGLIADLDISQDGSRILVATRPDPEQPGSGKPALLLLDAAGKRVWQRPVSWAIRAQSLSPDGKMVVVSTYDGKLTAIGSDGKNRWELEETCRPYVLKSQSVICYHDEDFAPDIAFDFFDKNGKKKLSYPISGDILGLALSSDERNLALALTGGRIVLLEHGSTDKRTPVRAIWQKKVTGEILDVAVGPGASPQVMALTRDPSTDKSKSKKVQLQSITHDGNILAPISLDCSAEQLGVSQSGAQIIVRGTRPSMLAVYETAAKNTPRAVARLESGADSRAPGPAPEIAMGLALGGGCKDCFLLWDAARNKKWELPVSPEATLFSVSRTKEPLLAIALDDGTLRLYRIKGLAP